MRVNLEDYREHPLDLPNEKDGKTKAEWCREGVSGDPSAYSNAHEDSRDRSQIRSLQNSPWHNHCRAEQRRAAQRRDAI